MLVSSQFFLLKTSPGDHFRCKSKCTAMELIAIRIQHYTANEWFGRVHYQNARGNREVAPDTPWKISMEPKSHPNKKENHLLMQHFWVPCWFSRVYWSISNDESKFLPTFLSFFLDSMGRVTGETVYTTSKYEWSAFFTFLAMNGIPRSLWFHFRFEILAQVTRGFLIMRCATSEFWKLHYV